MSDAYVIEVKGQAVVRDAGDGEGFRFLAATHAFNSLEGQSFSRPFKAERAARALVKGKVPAQTKPALRKPSGLAA